MDIRQVLEQAGLRQTKPRHAVLEVLANNRAPLEVVEIKDLARRKGVTMDKVTVYRIVEALIKTNVVTKVELQDGKSRYELVGHHHHHLVCDMCGKITDIDNCIRDDLEESIRQTKHFLVKRHTMEFFGLCKNCQ